MLLATRCLVCYISVNMDPKARQFYEDYLFYICATIVLIFDTIVGLVLLDVLLSR